MALLPKSKTNKQKINNIEEKKYPKLVDASAFRIFKRLTARLGIAHIRNKLFLGYCSIHKKYFLDLKHMNDTIRCPICDAQWLREYNSV